MPITNCKVRSKPVPPQSTLDSLVLEGVYSGTWENQISYQSLDAVLLESNYDPDMLANGPYPKFLKDRVAGPGGHISNIEAAEVLRSSVSHRMKWACLAHLSEHNNTPALAVKTHRQILGHRMPIFVASRYKASDVMEV